MSYIEINNLWKEYGACGDPVECGCEGMTGPFTLTAL